jgi:hypothetical protein
MQHELMRILAAIADPLCRLEPANDRVRSPAESGPQRRNSGAKKAGSAQAKEVSRKSFHQHGHPGSSRRLVCAVADKWWLLFSVEPLSRR